MKYEVFYLIGASREADADKIKEEVKNIVTASGGVFEEKETAEKRRLAYKVQHETHGIYIAQRFELPEAESIKDINNKLNLYTGILRFIISKASELPELKSKEERISEATRKETPAAEPRARQEARPEEKPEPKEEKPSEEPKKEEAPKKEKESDDDIDKKLEEILNI